MSITVLRLGIDTLEASIAGLLMEESAAYFDELKAKAQELETPQYLPLDSYEFAVQAQGSKPYSYKLAGNDASIRLTKSKKLPGPPSDSPHSTRNPNHEPLISVELFETVQEAYAPNRTKNNPKKRCYVLRDFLWCAECGAKITAGTHKGHVYYRCTHGKGDCSQSSYIKEETLVAQVSNILSQIEIDEEIAAALLAEAEQAASKGRTRSGNARTDLEASVRTVKGRSSLLVDRMLDGVISQDVYRSTADQLEGELSTLERRLSELENEGLRPSAEVEALARLVQGAHLEFDRGDLDLKRRTLAAVLCNAAVEGGKIASYQYKGPLGFLEMSPEKAFINEWWAIVDAFVLQEATSEPNVTPRRFRQADLSTRPIPQPYLLPATPTARPFTP